MYESYWNLSQKPFEESCDPALYYPGESHQGALLKMRYAVESRRGAAVLAGASGTGKSLLMNLLRSQLPEQFHPVVPLVFPAMPVGELLRLIADHLEVDGATTADTSDSVRRIEKRLATNAQDGKHAVLIIDEAHLLTDREVLQALRLLLNFEGPQGPLMTQIWVGQPQLLVHLDRMPDLEERLGVKSMLRPFTLEETMSYVTHRMNAAGQASEVFDAVALEALHELTGGVARRINRLADLALLIGFAEQRERITAEHVEAVSDELVCVRPE